MTHPAILTLSKRVGAFPIEWPAAAMLAGAVAFATLAMPDWRFERLVAMTGLADLTTAASPPLGTTARVLAALALACIAFVGAWSGLRALETHSLAGGFPAFRAADRHPDAPRRRPIRADAEFGTPVETAFEPVRRRKLVASEALPSFLTPQSIEYADFESELTELANPVAASSADTGRDDVPDLIARLEQRLSKRDMQAAPAAIGEGTNAELLDILCDLDRVRDAARA